MNAANDNLRYERKLLPIGYGLPDVLALVRHHPSGFRETYPSRWVNNIYLDSHGLDDYHDHVTGLADRSKSRIRWYGDLSGAISKPVFERKFKRGVVGGKRSHTTSPLTLNGGLDERKLREMLNGTGEKDPLLRCLEYRSPSLINRYRRHYYESGDGRVRLTVDTELGFYEPESASPELASKPPEAFEVVIELKYAPDESDIAADVANGFPCRIVRCSKYVLGIEAIRRS